jgi:hypothetical protein
MLASIQFRGEQPPPRLRCQPPAAATRTQQRALSPRAISRADGADGFVARSGIGSADLVGEPVASGLPGYAERDRDPVPAPPAGSRRRENVYPAEVEEVLYQHPGVAEVAVVGVPDERWVETGAAWLVPRPGTEVDPEEIRCWARERLAAFKVPRDVHLVDALPRNATGKVLEAELRRRPAGGSAS